MNPHLKATVCAWVIYILSVLIFTFIILPLPDPIYYILCFAYAFFYSMFLFDRVEDWLFIKFLNQKTNKNE